MNKIIINIINTSVFIHNFSIRPNGSPGLKSFIL